VRTRLGGPGVRSSGRGEGFDAHIPPSSAPIPAAGDARLAHFAVRASTSQPVLEWNPRPVSSPANG
jgi:hypothetical protein